MPSLVPISPCPLAEAPDATDIRPLLSTETGHGLIRWGQISGSWTPPGNGPATVPILQIDEDVAAQQLGKTAALRRARSQDNVQAALTALREAASGTANTMPALLDAVRAYATIGEMCDALRDVWGEYQEQAII